tara:strand:- start:275 stop:496 length:222 start_codon:yes stop_codon:yes gene_type:complete
LAHAAAKRATFIMDAFLTKEEVEFLTGYKHVEKQSKWLALEGIKFFVSRDGSTRNANKKFKVVVARNAVMNSR